MEDAARTGRAAAQARVTWGAGDVPISSDYDDPYFAREDGLGETRHVFLGGNGLPARWRGRAAFTVAELGFGTGLNCLATIKAWRDFADKPTGTRLNFVSFEKAPLAPADMARALRAWPELADLAALLVDGWLVRPTEGTVRVALPGVMVDVLIGDAAVRLGDWAGAADAWYLDGFSPSRNGDLWSAAVMERVFALTAPGGTFATYSAAGWVRRNLAAAGFVVEKFPGHGRKRESLRGMRPGGGAGLEPSGP